MIKIIDTILRKKSGRKEPVTNAGGIKYNKIVQIFNELNFIILKSTH